MQSLPVLFKNPANCTYNPRRTIQMSGIRRDLIGMSTAPAPATPASKIPKKSYNVVISFNFATQQEQEEAVKRFGGDGSAGSKVLYTGVHYGTVFQRVITQKTLTGAIIEGGSK